MASHRPPLLLMPIPVEPLDVHVQIPRPNDNLFERLIRDPQAPHRPMRERQCAEMLRTVLVACPSLASLVLKWFAEIADVPIGIIDNLNWTLETEQAIGTKRDDLRIEGRRADGDDQQRAVLWTVEIKVAAPLHESSLQDLDAVPEEGLEDDPEMVSQLLNYDKWLTHQESGYKAGFVLALRDTTPALPGGLNQSWHCITWTQLALEVEIALADDLVAMSERSFAKHMLGFIRHRLWDTTDMTSSRLELDDVALLRALAAIGPSCSGKLKDLVKQFAEIFKSTGIAFQDIKQTTSVFDRVDLPQYFIWAECTTGKTWLNVNAGIVADDVKVWISCNPTVKESKQAVRKLLRELQSELTDRNPSWVIYDADAPGFLDAEIKKPLVSVLALEDWQTPLIDFVQQAVNDLKQVGILEALVQFE